MSMDNIDHVVVLMLENRSFDSLLGWLYEHDAPAVNIPAAAPDDRYRGLQCVDLDTFANTALDGTLTVEPTRGAQGFSVPTVDPGEEFDHIEEQFFGTRQPSPGQAATMTGVLADFVDVLQKRKLGAADVRRLAPMAMQSFTPSQVPVLSQLARHYAVSDDWFASVPSQTNPNRAFTLCGTSNGMVDNGFLEVDPRAPAIEAALGMKIGDDRIDAATIFNALDAAERDWAVFWQTSYLPQKMSTLIDMLEGLIAFLNTIPSGITWAAKMVADALAFLAALKDLGPDSLAYLHELSAGDLDSSYTWRLFPSIRDGIGDAAAHFQRLDDFHTRARSGTLPAFSYIEPFWSISHTTTDNSVAERLISTLGNDYHPPSNVLVGEEFVKDVYTSLISNTAAWQRTLLLITFDEFVGSFDHVTDGLQAGRVSPPWGKTGTAPVCQEGFGFDRLGARVPTILVSPYVQKGTVFRSTKPAPYDHTSLIATTMKWIAGSGDTSGFGSRASEAPTFEGALTLAEPRTDEADLPFLDTERFAGDPLRYGDSFVLQNQSGDFLSAAYPTMKFLGGGSMFPQKGIDLLADIGLAAYFPRCGSGDTATLSFVSHLADPGPQVEHGDTVRVVSREPQLGSRNILGTWADSKDCYYYDEYVDGTNAGNQAWTIQKVDVSKGPAVSYGDRVYVVSASAAYSGQRLTRDPAWIKTDKWITTSASGGDWWTVVPAPARVGQGRRQWDRAPAAIRAVAAAQGGSRGLQLWTFDPHFVLESTYQESPSGTWSPWMDGWSSGGPSRSVAQVTAALQNHTEVVQIWAVGYGSAPGQLWSRYQTAPGGGWTDWFTWDGAPVGGAIASCREGGPRCVRLWSIDAAGSLRCNVLDGPNGRWTGWSAANWNGAPAGLMSVCAVLQADDTIRAWVADKVGNVFTSVQRTPGGDAWSGWEQMCRFNSWVTLTACQLGGGGLQLWAKDVHGVLHSTQQAAPGAPWAPWDPPADQATGGWQGATVIADVAAAHQPGGDTALWVIGPGQRLHHKSWTGGRWEEWTPHL